MLFCNITPFSGGTPMFRKSVLYYWPAIQLHQCLFNPVQRVSAFQPVPTGVFELASIPHVFLKFAYVFLVLEEEAGGFVETCNLGCHDLDSSFSFSSFLCHPPAFFPTPSNASSYVMTSFSHLISCTLLITRTRILGWRRSLCITTCIFDIFKVL